MDVATSEATRAGRTAATTVSRTVADLLPLAVERYPDLTAVLEKVSSGEWVGKTYREVGAVVESLALGLIELGIEPGDKVAILAGTCPDWTYFDFAALTAGATVVPIYQTNSREECEYILANSDARAVVVENADQLAKIAPLRGVLPKLEHVIMMVGEPNPSDGAISTAELKQRGAGREHSEWTARWNAVDPDDICTFIYTSGTTGPPKGCVISHANYRAMVSMTRAADLFEPGELTYLFLPLAHSFALLVQFASFDLGGGLAYWEGDPLKIVPNLAEVKPNYFPSVPRIFEKIHTTITASVEKQGGLKAKIFWWAIGIGHRVRELERAGEKPGFLLAKQHAFADKRVLSTIRGIFGGNVKACTSGAAPISPEILRFFDAAGVLVLEGYGMTETSTAATISTPDAFKFGTVGRAFDGVEIMIASDGEILIKGPNVFQGYYKNDDATAETIVDGRLHTGDIGELDSDGYLTITGRKKDIIITAGGKNITPANLEGEIKQHPLVSQAVVIGDRRPYLVALLTLDPEEAAAYATERETAVADLVGDSELRAGLQAHFDQFNQRYARVEQVKKFTILPTDLSQARGELTPTLKVKRNVIATKYATEIDRLYDSGSDH